MHKDSTYRINVYTFNKTLEFPDRIKRIDVSRKQINEWMNACENVELCECIFDRSQSSHQAMDYLPFEGTVSLKSPQHIFCLLEDYGTDPNDIPEHPNYIYFGRWVRHVWPFVYISKNKRWSETQHFKSTLSPAPDSRWTTWTDPLSQCEEQTLHREH